MLKMNEVQGSEGSDIKVINDGNPGIAENIFLETVETGTNEKTGSDFIKFTFSDQEGGKLSHYEYAVEANAENKDQKIQSQLKRLKHIATKFVPENTNLPEADSFSDLYGKLVTFFQTNKASEKKLRAKLVYNGKNYLSLPKYVPFLENMEVAPEDTRLKIKSIEDGGIDKMTKSQDDNPAAMAASAGSPFPADAGGMVSAAASDNAPF
jgi:hypothetical protein